MTKFVLAVLGLFALLTVIAIGGFYLFGPPGGVLGVILFIWLMQLGFKFLLSRLFGLGKALLESKSRVLRGATAVVHSIKATPAPKNCGTQGTPGNSTCFYLLDVTIAPPALIPTTPHSSWDPHELTVIPFDAKAPDIDSDEAGDYGCEVHEISLITDRDTDGGEKSCASTRLKLHIEVPERTKRLKFCYYFETFGDLQIL